MTRFASALLVALLAAIAPAQALQLVSRAADGGYANGASLSYGNVVSEDGRYVVFESAATNIVSDDTNARSDIFLRDVRKGTTQRISVDGEGKEANGASLRPSISSDGHYVVFWSLASNLVPGDTNGKWDVFLRDLRAGTTERIDLTASGAQCQGDNEADVPVSISRNGKYIVWASEAPDLVEGDRNETWDVFLRDRENGVTELVSSSEKGEMGDGASIQPTVSDDGSMIAFRSMASNLIPGDVNKSWDIFVRDRKRKTLQCATLSFSGAFGQANHDGPSNYPTSMTRDGRYLAFESSAADLVPGDTNGQRDVFVRDLRSGRTLRISMALGGGGKPTEVRITPP